MTNNMQCQSTIEIASKIHADVKANINTRLAYRVDPIRLAARRVPTPTGDAPLFSLDGESRDLASLLDSFNRWDGEILVGAHFDGKLFDFWIDSEQAAR